MAVLRKVNMLLRVGVFAGFGIVCAVALGEGGSGWLVYYESAFRGKVIDAETKAPIEGAVVVAIYQVHAVGPAHGGNLIASVKEVLTDSRGEFYIPSHIYTHPYPLTLGGDIASFIIYKPGYGDYPNNYVFLIYPLKESLKVMDREGKTEMVEKEGIVFQHNFRRLDEKSRAIYKKKFVNWLPFVSLKNPTEKIKTLDIPFEVDLDTADTVWWSLIKEPFKTHPVIGLPRLKTREERLKAEPSTPADYGPKDLPLLYRTINDERKRYGLQEITR